MSDVQNVSSRRYDWPIAIVWFLNGFMVAGLLNGWLG